jgi:hypothetical protein
MANSAYPSFWNFLASFRRRWFAAMSGGLSVPFTLGAVYASGKWEKAGYAFLALLCGVYASFLVWKDERIKHNTTRAELARIGELPSERHKALCAVQLSLAELAWKYRIDGVTRNNREAYAKAAHVIWDSISEKLFPHLYQNERVTLTKRFSEGAAIFDSDTHESNLIHGYLAMGYLEREIEMWASAITPRTPPVPVALRNVVENVNDSTTE